MRSTTYRPCDLCEMSKGSGCPSIFTPMSYGVRKARGALASYRSKNRKMPCLPTPGKSTVSFSVTARSPFAATRKSAS